MINEAFWLFYAVGIVHKLGAFTFVYGLGVAALLIVSAGAMADCSASSAEWVKWRRWAVSGIVSAMVFALATFLAPTKEALYAGAGLYVAEETEVTDTLLRLKDVVDARIEELMPEQAQQQESAQ